MIIKNFRTERKNGFKRVVASVVWEDSKQKNRDIFFETTDEFSKDLQCNPNAFLVGCIIPAMYFGEKRIRIIDGEICPILQDGLITSMSWYRCWYGSKYQPVIVEAKKMNYQSPSVKKKRVGLFFSGGVDSCFSLRINRLNIPLNHPESIQDCFLIHGFDIGYDDNAEKEMDIFSRAIKIAEEIAKDAQVNLIPVYTNIRCLHNDTPFWMKWSHGAALSSVAHCFSSRINKVLIASSHSTNNLEPWGSHPLIDPNYSSLDLEIVHDRLCSRVKKTEVVANWEVALQNFRICTHNPKNQLNCGKCVKCIRTMIQLLAFGKLKYTKAFPVNDVSPGLFKKVAYSTEIIDYREHYQKILHHLEEKGRYDLIKIIRAELGWKGNLRRFDQKYCRGILSKLWGILKRNTGNNNDEKHS